MPPNKTPPTGLDKMQDILDNLNEAADLLKDVFDRNNPANEELFHGEITFSSFIAKFPSDRHNVEMTLYRRTKGKIFVTETHDDDGKLSDLTIEIEHDRFIDKNGDSCSVKEEIMRDHHDKVVFMRSRNYPDDGENSALRHMMSNKDDVVERVDPSGKSAIYFQPDLAGGKETVEIGSVSFFLAKLKEIKEPFSDQLLDNTPITVAPRKPPKI